MPREYTSTMARYSIHRPSILIAVDGPGGVPTFRQHSFPPIEFESGKYVSRSDEEDQFMQSYPGYRVDYFLVPSAEELRAGEEERKQARIESLKAELDQLGGGAGKQPEIIPSVSNKTEALEALAARGVDTSFADARTTKDEILDAAKAAGYVFEGW